MSLALTVTADPANSVAVAGSERFDWSLRLCAQGAGESEDEARQRLHEISMVRSGGTVSLVAPRQLLKDHTGHGELVVDAPGDAPLVIHVSYAAVQLRDMKGPVRIAATHGRATILDTTGQVDAVAFVIDFSSSRGRVTLSAEAEINMNPCLRATMREDACSSRISHALSRHREPTRRLCLSDRVRFAREP
jgi:hypothetical protein